MKKRGLLKFLLAITLVSAGVGIALAGARYFSHRAELARWAPEKAVTEAANDIQAGSMKIYLHGTFAAYAVGVEDGQYSLIQHLPRMDAGVGCAVSDEDLLDAQREYAVRYNKAIVEYLRKRTGQPRP